MPNPHEEPWDELMGPPPTIVDEVDRFLRGEVSLDHSRSNTPIPSTSSTVASSSSYRPPASPPPHYAFTRSVSSNSAGLPERWTRHAPTLEESKAATQRAVLIAAERDPTPAAGHFSSSASVSSVASATSSVSFKATGAAKRKPDLLIEGIHTDPHYNSDDYSAEDHNDDESYYSNYSSKIDPPESFTHYRDQEHEGYEHNGSYYHNTSAGQIRQDALKVLQVVDDQLSSSTYSVHRTVTGGFMASANSLGTKKRVPTALSGLSFTASGRNSRANGQIVKPYRDNPEDDDEGSARQNQPRVTNDDTSNYPPLPPPADRDDYEYADDDVVDYINSSRDKKDGTASNNWSSRYSINNSLLALSGGATPTSNRKFLDQLDNESSATSRTSSLFSSSLSPGGSLGMFGTAGFNFRQKHIFGKQSVTMPPPQTNLRTVWIDIEKEHKEISEEGYIASETKKSWSDQMAMKRRRRRSCLMILLAICILTITIACFVSKSKRNASAASVSSASTVNDVTFSFYATANVPFSTPDQATFAEKLNDVDTSARFLVHLGNIQQPQVTRCQTPQYSNVANLLSTSPIPVFVLPGMYDWSECPDPTAAWSSWYSNFALFDTTFSHDFQVARQMNHMENFAFETNGDLFIGMHIIAGPDSTSSETTTRNADDMSWVQEMIKDNPSANSITILGNSAPADSGNVNFFVSLSRYLDSVGKPAMYVHAGPVDTSTNPVQKAYWIGNLYVVQVPNGGSYPFSKILVTSGSRPFKLV